MYVVYGPTQLCVVPLAWAERGHLYTFARMIDCACDNMASHQYTRVSKNCKSNGSIHITVLYCGCTAPLSFGLAGYSATENYAPVVAFQIMGCVR